MPSVPLDPLLPHLIDLMSNAIDAADWKRAPLTVRQEAQRTAITAAVLMLPATCREARALAKNDELRWAWMLAYELARTNTGAQLRLYDGLPSGCGSLKQVPAVRPLFDFAAPATARRNGQVDFINRCREDTSEMHKARRLFAMHAEHDTRLPELNGKSVADMNLDVLTEAPDLPDAVPHKVRAFAGYCRGLWQSASTDPCVFRERPCGRRGCPRSGHDLGDEDGEYRLGFTQGSHRRLHVQNPEDNAHVEGERDYWRDLQQHQRDFDLRQHQRDSLSEPDEEAPASTETMLDGAVYCCTACALQCADEYDAIVRCAAVDELATRSTTRDGRNSAARQFRAVVKRNQVIARRMRATRDAQTRHLPARFDLAAERQRVRDVLCIDTGIVYAGALVGELPRAARPPRALPAFNGWRSLGLPNRGDAPDGVWGGAIRKVCDIYAPHRSPARLAQHRAEGLVESHLSTPRWLSRVKDQCLSVI
jgi:hypothetical protein